MAPLCFRESSLRSRLKALSANTYSELRHHLVGGSEARFLYQHFASNVATIHLTRTFAILYALKGILNAKILTHCHIASKRGEYLFL